MSMPGFLRSSFVACVAFVGKHFARESDILFEDIRVSFSHLDDWTRITGFEFKLETDGHGRFTKQEINYAFPAVREHRVDNVMICFDYGFTSGGDRIKEVNLKQTSFIKARTDVPVHFDDYQRNIYVKIRNLLCLAIGQPVYPMIVKGRVPRSKVGTEDDEVLDSEIQVFYAMAERRDSFGKIHPSKMTFVYEDVASDFEIILRNWFANYSNLQPVCDLFFGTFYNSSMYPQHEFLSLTQAAETYHRRMFGGKYVEDDAYDKIYDNLVGGIPPEICGDFRENLKQKMRYYNEFSLRKRLKELFERYGDALKVLISRPDEFIDAVVNTRNFLTHYDKKIEDKSKHGDDLYGLIKKVRGMLEICLLTQLGVSSEMAQKWITRNQRYANYSRY
jgi:hypothetical protein